MRHEKYIARKRARFNAIGGHPVNIPYGTALECKGGFIMWQGKKLCYPTSQLAFEFFSQNDDGNSLKRGELVGKILSRLEKQDGNHQNRWDKIWADSLCRKYRRAEHEDQWLWSYDFYNAPVDDLRQIAALIGA